MQGYIQTGDVGIQDDVGRVEQVGRVGPKAHGQHLVGVLRMNDGPGGEPVDLKIVVHDRRTSGAQEWRGGGKVGGCGVAIKQRARLVNSARAPVGFFSNKLFPRPPCPSYAKVPN